MQLAGIGGAVKVAVGVGSFPLISTEAVALQLYEFVVAVAIYASIPVVCSAETGYVAFVAASIGVLFFFHAYVYAIL